MEGHGVVDLGDDSEAGKRDYNGGRGNLVQFLDAPANAAKWADLRGANGSFVARDDVVVSYLTEHGTQKAGALTVGYAVHDDAHHFGPELGIGRVLGARFIEPVLLIKTAWGGKSLAKDFRPPSAGGVVGPYYTKMLEQYRAALAAIATQFPAYAQCTPVLDGFIWMQGWNDGCDPAAAAEYEENLVHLITDVRAALGNESLPFVVGESGNMDGETGMVLRNAQKNGCARSEVAAGTLFVSTHEFLRKPQDSPNSGHGHHWFGNGESYLLIGDALGRAMVQLIEAREAPPSETPAVPPAKTKQAQ